MPYPFFETLTDHMTEEPFLKKISGKYHYSESQLPMLAAVAVSMQKQILRDVGEQRAGWNWGGLAELTPVCITLGPGIDSLQEVYLEQGLLSEAYMVEMIATELLQQAYPLWNDWLAAGSDRKVRRYRFLGSDDFCAVERLPELLREMDIPVTCTEGYCMLPKKSVFFYAELTVEPGVVCQGICMGCDSLNCPNRADKNFREGSA